MEENVNLLDYVWPMNWKFIGVTNGKVQTANKWVDGNYSKNMWIMVGIINIHHNFINFNCFIHQRSFPVLATLNQWWLGCIDLK